MNVSHEQYMLLTSYVTDQVKLFVGNPFEVQEKANKWLSNHRGKITVRNICFCHPDAHYETISIMVWYEEIHRDDLD